MSRRKLAGIVTRQSEVEGKPSHSVELRCGEVWAFNKLRRAGVHGVTCRDFNGADWRHYARNLRKKGIGLRVAWESDSFGRHKRWWLKSGHSFQEIPYVSKKKKPAAAATERASNSITSKLTGKEVLNE